MVKLEKSGVIMVVAETMAKMFEDMGYARGTDVEPVTPTISIPNTPVASKEVKNHEETENENRIEDRTENEKKYSRSEITRMSTADLKTTAKSIGLEVTDESTGKALKEAILKKLGL